MKHRSVSPYAASLFPIDPGVLHAYSRLREYGIKVGSIDSPLLVAASERLEKASRLLGNRKAKLR